MFEPAFRQRLDDALSTVEEMLQSERNSDGVWTGELSSSALSTATAVCALSAAREAGGGDPEDAALVELGLAWLVRHANGDGGWGDTDWSLSNLSTTALCWSALAFSVGERHRDTVVGAEQYIARNAGGLDAGTLVHALEERYGKDRTFSVPIVMTCALAGRLGTEGWCWVKQLPFELTALPHQVFGALRLPVVSYAMPALIAIGYARHHRVPSRSFPLRWGRDRLRYRALKILRDIQPENGGFLEAIPLTSFVAMALASAGLALNEVTGKCLAFLRESVRADGSWPIDTNLATWLTTLRVNSTPPPSFSREEAQTICQWLLRQQHRCEHPYTHAAPGGWAWTDLPGGVPDADDTAGALIALRALGDLDPSRSAAVAGCNWLIGLQNRDGGIPTFCRGWGTLPFDRSAPDLTAHALRAWLVWRSEMPLGLQRRVDKAVPRALTYLRETQREDGSWVPLWFGNERAPNDENPTYGTARVLFALSHLAPLEPRVRPLLARAVPWLLTQQDASGGWGGIRGTTPTIEETALALEAIASARNLGIPEIPSYHIDRAILSGARWLIEKIEAGGGLPAAPIGFYFAKLWYYEKLYPLIFTANALRSVARLSG